MAETTNRPWYYYSGQHAVYSLGTTPERSVCYVSGPRKHTTPEREAERDANGRLMAAAPDLYDALLQAVTLLALAHLDPTPEIEAALARVNPAR